MFNRVAAKVRRHLDVLVVLVVLFMTAHHELAITPYGQAIDWLTGLLYTSLGSAREQLLNSY